VLADCLHALHVPENLVLGFRPLHLAVQLCGLQGFDLLPKHRDLSRKQLGALKRF
jgi:hypothetical protein